MHYKHFITNQNGDDNGTDLEATLAYSNYVNDELKATHSTGKSNVEGHVNG